MAEPAPRFTAIEVIMLQLWGWRLDGDIWRQVNSNLTYELAFDGKWKIISTEYNIVLATSDKPQSLVAALDGIANFARSLEAKLGDMPS